MNGAVLSMVRAPFTILILLIIGNDGSSSRKEDEGVVSFVTSSPGRDGLRSLWAKYCKLLVVNTVCVCEGID